MRPISSNSSFDLAIANLIRFWIELYHFSLVRSRSHFIEITIVICSNRSHSQVRENFRR
ncbi:MAG: hypothetical protein MUD14_05055 [Hydrococcus sp. Prado102]|nr:hypothetical protein [Hydrococcus sp. Prado102]